MQKTSQAHQHVIGTLFAKVCAAVQAGALVATESCPGHTLVAHFLGRRAHLSLGWRLVDDLQFTNILRAIAAEALSLTLTENGDGCADFIVEGRRSFVRSATPAGHEEQNKQVCKPMFEKDGGGRKGGLMIVAMASLDLGAMAGVWSRVTAVRNMQRNCRTHANADFFGVVGASSSESLDSLNYFSNKAMLWKWRHTTLFQRLMDA